MQEEPVYMSRDPILCWPVGRGKTAKWSDHLGKVLAVIFLGFCGEEFSLDPGGGWKVCYLRFQLCLRCKRGN